MIRYVYYLYIPLVLLLLGSLISLFKTVLRLAKDAEHIVNGADKLNSSLYAIQIKSTKISETLTKKVPAMFAAISIPLLVLSLFRKKKPFSKKVLTVSKIVGGMRHF